MVRQTNLLKNTKVNSYHNFQEIQLTYLKNVSYSWFSRFHCKKVSMDYVVNDAIHSKSFSSKITEVMKIDRPLLK